MPLSKKDKYMEELEELAKRQYFESIETKRAHIENKNKYRNLTRCLNTLRREEEEDQRVERAQEPTTLRQAELEEEEQMARALDMLKKEDMRRKLMRQHLRENSHELRELERKLRAAYITKEQMAQMAEKNAIDVQQTLNEEEAKRLLQSVWFKDEEFRKQKMKKEIEQKEQYRQELQDQIILNEKNRRYKYEEFLREKKMLDDIAQGMHDEDQRAIEERMRKMKKTREEIDAFKAAQELWKKKQREEIAEENRRIQEYWLSKESTAKRKREQKERQEAAKAKISDEIAKNLYEAERQQREREEVVMQLLVEEKKEEAEKRHREEVEKELRQRVETLASLNRQMQERKEQLELQAKEDALYKEQLTAKIAEDERLEQLSNEKKRKKLLEIKKSVEESMEQRRQLKAEQMQREMRLLEEEQKEAEQRKQLIQDERIKMLQEHATNLIGYLPKGILRPEDLIFLSGEVIRKYGDPYKIFFTEKKMTD